VDDDAQVRAVSARALADAGFDVLQAHDAITALNLLEDTLGAGVCLVITDVAMPGMTGDELGRKLHRVRPTLPVLYMSGHSRPNMDFLSESDLLQCWIDKPFSLATLVARARTLCVADRSFSI
jgi:DNA-binding response OmpR family regulator